MCCTSDFIRCRWSCVTSAPTGTTLTENWSRGSSSWSRSWTTWLAASSRHRSCCLRSYVTETRRSGKRYLQLLAMRLLLHRTADNTWQDVVAELNWNTPALEDRRSLFCFSFHFLSFCRWHGCKCFFHKVSVTFPSAARIRGSQGSCRTVTKQRKHLIQFSAACVAQWLKQKNYRGIFLL